jgi:hypothetical protein
MGFCRSVCHVLIVLAFTSQCGVTVDIKVYAQIKAFLHGILNYFAIDKITLQEIYLCKHAYECYSWLYLGWRVEYIGCSFRFSV